MESAPTATDFERATQHWQTLALVFLARLAPHDLDPLALAQSMGEQALEQTPHHPAFAQHSDHDRGFYNPFSGENIADCNAIHGCIGCILPANPQTKCEGIDRLVHTAAL